MSAPRPKSPDLIKAQIAAFTAERVPHRNDAAYIYDKIGELALADTHDLSRRLEINEYHGIKDGAPYRIPAGTEHTVATADEYLGFLRSEGGSGYESVKVREELLGAYYRFKPIVDSLKQELDDPVERRNHPDFLAAGLHSLAYTIRDGAKTYVARIPHGRIDTARTHEVDARLAGAVLGKGIPHLEQFVAASYEDGVTISELIPGKNMRTLSLEEVAGITDEQLGTLIDTLLAVGRRRIEVDIAQGNVLYDTEEGFGIVDYHSAKVVSKNSANQEYGAPVGWAAQMILRNMGFKGPYDSGDTAADYAKNLERVRANLDVIIRYRRIAETKLDGVQVDVLDLIDRNIQGMYEDIDHYTDPEWVAARIASDARSIARRRAGGTNSSMQLDVL